MIHFSKHSGIYTLEVQQELPITIEEAWDFFATPRNLVHITPPHMRFQITSSLPERMFPGQIISYVVGILPGIKTSWVTEITHMEEHRFFVDEQRFGPYSMWHHEHHFEEKEEGILMTDRVSYKIPFGFLGHIAQRIFVKKQLKTIFEYRVKSLEERFG